MIRDLYISSEFTVAAEKTIMLEGTSSFAAAVMHGFTLHYTLDLNYDLLNTYKFIQKVFLKVDNKSIATKLRAFMRSLSL